jgi:dipeptidyl-peptidase 4
MFLLDPPCEILVAKTSRGVPRSGVPRNWHVFKTCLVVVLLVLASPLRAQNVIAPATANQGNYKLATKFSSSFLRQFTYDTSVSPKWIGDSETFWYRFRTSQGRRYWLVDPIAKTKVALFDHDHLSALLSELCETPFDSDALDLGGVVFDKTGDEMKFSMKGTNFVYKRSTETLEKDNKPKKSSSSSSSRGRGSRRRGSSDAKRQLSKKEEAQAKKDREKRLLAQWRKALEERKKKLDKESGKEGDESQEEVGARGQQRRARGHRSAFSPDLSQYVVAKNHNLYLVERTGDLQEIDNVLAADVAPKKAAASKGNQSFADWVKQSAKTLTNRVNAAKKKAGVAEATVSKDGKESVKPKKEALRFPFLIKQAVQLASDGVEDYSYGGNDEDDFSMPATVTWSDDSTAFFVTRGDSRGVAELFLVDSLGQPRPSLRQYKYSMPGEDKVRHSELMIYKRSTGKMVRLQPKWKDESYVDVRWLPSGELRVMRRDRLLRNLEYGIADLATGELKVLFDEHVKDVGLATQSIRYLDDRKEFLWWSERSGWGHYYLYGMDGKLKNAVTRGRFRASSIVDVDEEKGLLWFRGNGRERGESIYHEHLYRVRLDGGDLTLLDPGDATHRSQLSKSRNFLVDNCSRTDLTPSSVLRNREGELVMELEKSDVSQLKELGWRPPERFVVKAADGITNLYGNMWKPFDFDASKSYPLIVHVYPGPQTEGVTHTFSATSSRQELAQVGFIVIQVGHRGGAPTRSKAYGSYGYFNMRDYPLEDKKTAIEQLAARHDFIDASRIGIYGHSGGGFMTAAALLKKPYNKFFKVGVSTSGNHDNNVYNNYWAERYHGLKEKKGAGDKRSVAQLIDSSIAKVVNDYVEDEKKKEKKDRKEKVEVVDRNKKDGTKGVVKKGGSQRDVDDDQGKVQKSKSKQSRVKLGGGKSVEQGKGRERSNDSVEKNTKFDIKIATNAELAENLEGKLLLIHGEIDNNVHPAGTMRLVDALIKANKRFDMLIIPGARHSYGKASTYAKHRTWEYFAEHLLGDRQPNADIHEKATDWSR